MGQLVDGKWADDARVPRSKDGAFRRGASGIRHWVETDPSAEFPAEAGRYLIYVSLACPWAHRTLVTRALKGLHDAIEIAIVDWHMTDEGWHFSDRDGATPDPVAGHSFLRDVYTASDGRYSGRVTVPVLWDKQSARIVSNESAEIIRMLNDAFDALAAQDLDLYPAPLREEIDTVNARVYDAINNGVYKCGFAGSQAAYEAAFDDLFEALDDLEVRLDGRNFLVGESVTEADVRLFTTLVRFDPVYHTHFKCNLRRIADYPNLSAYLDRMLTLPGVAETVDLHHIKWHYFHSHRSINPLGIVPKGPDSPSQQRPA